MVSRTVRVSQDARTAATWLLLATLTLWLLSLVAYANAFDDTFLVATVVAAVGALLGLTLRRNYAAQAAQAPASSAGAGQAGGMEMAAG